MPLFEIDQNTCKQDGICAAVCPAGIIAFEKGGYPELVDGQEKACIQCGHCVAVCPTGSLSHREMPVDQCPPMHKELQLWDHHCEHFLRSRRSIRTYKKGAVDKSEIERLIEMARYAPSGRNAQDTKWLVLGNRNELHRLSELVVDWMRWIISNQPGLAATLQLEGTVDRWEAGKDVILRGAPNLIIAYAEKGSARAVYSCTIALAYLELAATSMGVGCCWAGYFNAAAATFPPMIEALALPEEHQCYGAMMVGYPKYAYHRLPLRNPPAISWRM